MVVEKVEKMVARKVSSMVDLMVVESVYHWDVASVEKMAVTMVE